MGNGDASVALYIKYRVEDLEEQLAADILTRAEQKKREEAERRAKAAQEAELLEMEKLKQKARRKQYLSLRTTHFQQFKEEYCSDSPENYFAERNMERKFEAWLKGKGLWID